MMISLLLFYLYFIFILLLNCSLVCWDTKKYVINKNGNSLIVIPCWWDGSVERYTFSFLSLLLLFVSPVSLFSSLSSHNLIKFLSFAVLLHPYIFNDLIWPCLRLRVLSLWVPPFVSFQVCYSYPILWFQGELTRVKKDGEVSEVRRDTN